MTTHRCRGGEVAGWAGRQPRAVWGCPPCPAPGSPQKGGCSGGRLWWCPQAAGPHRADPIPMPSAGGDQQRLPGVCLAGRPRSLSFDCWAEGRGRGVAPLPPAVRAGWPAVAGPGRCSGRASVQRAHAGRRRELAPQPTGLSEHVPPRGVLGTFRGCSGCVCRHRQMFPF